MTKSVEGEFGDELLSEEEVDRLNEPAEGLATEPRGERFDELRLIWELTDAPEGHDDWWRLQARIRAEERARSDASPRRWRRLAPLATAAAVAGLIAGSFLESTSGIWPSARLPEVVVTVPSGDQATLMLAPGIEVHLNSATTLTYVPVGKKLLDLALDGEAYFAVGPEAERSLQVRTAAGVIRDIGTKFNVFAREGRVSVVVEEGAVELEAGERTVLVEAGEEAMAESGGVPTRPQPTDLAAQLAWRQGVISAFAQPLGEVAREIERRYAVSIEVAEELAGKSVTLVLRSPTAAAAMAAVCAAVEEAICVRGEGYWQVRSRP